MPMNQTDQAIEENKARYEALCREADMSIAHALGRVRLKRLLEVPVAPTEGQKALIQFVSEL